LIPHLANLISRIGLEHQLPGGRGSYLLGGRLTSIKSTNHC
jgi:hypothetical protein